MYVSPIVSRIWGLPAEEFERLPYPQFFAAHAHPDDWDGLDLEGMKSPGYEREFRIIRPDKSVRWVRVTTGSVMDNDMHVTKVVGHGEEITPRKTAELELIRGLPEENKKPKCQTTKSHNLHNNCNSENGSRGDCARTDL